MDKKVYKTDYQSEFTKFFDKVSEKDEPKPKNVNREKELYAEINHLRDNADNPEGRNKLWEGF